jgi:Zn-dependent protease with chaperone function
VTTAPSRHRPLTDPEARIPSGTSIRFAVLVLVITASTGSVFGYFWQLSEPGRDARIGSCLAGSSSDLASLVRQFTGSTPAPILGSADCVRPVAGSLALWFLIGIGLLAVTSALGYRLTPAWTIRHARPGPRRGLLPVKDYPPDPKRYCGQLARLAELVERAGLAADSVTFMVDPNAWEEPTAQAFGRAREPRIRIDAGLLMRYQSQAETFEDVVLHELAHVRNRDLLPTYVTLAAWRAFTVLLPAGYLVAVTVSGAPPSVPSLRTVLLIGALVGLVLLSTRAVLRARELHADAVAAHVSDSGTLRFVLDEAAKPRPPRWSRLLTYHPAYRVRKETLQDARRLYRADHLALLTTGIAVGIIASDLTPVVFAAILGSRLGTAPALLRTNGGQGAVEYRLLTYGPASLIAAVLISAVACAASWRSRYGAAAGADPVRPAGLALSATLGLILGDLLGFENAGAGIWGVFDTTAPRILAVTALCGVFLLFVFVLLFRWAAEAAAAWADRAGARIRTVVAVAALVGGLAVAPLLLAWESVHQIPLALQLLFGPSAAQSPYIGGWPAARALFLHDAPLGVYDSLPGASIGLVLACLFIAVGGWRRTPVPVPDGADQQAHNRRRPRGPLGPALMIGSLGALVAGAFAFALMLGLHALLGPLRIALAGEYGLIYLTRSTQALIVLCAAAAGLLAARRAPGTSLAAGILAALVTVVGAALAAPEAIYDGFLGWGHIPVNPINGHFFYGLLANMTAGGVVIATVVLVILAGGRSDGTLSGAAHSQAALRIEPPTLPLRDRLTALATKKPLGITSRLGAVLLICLLIVGMVYAGYYFYSIAISPTPKIHPR